MRASPRSGPTAWVSRPSSTGSKAAAIISPTSPRPSSPAASTNSTNSRLDGIDWVVACVDTWTAWAHGRPVASTNLAAAVETLTEHAWHSPLFVASPGVGRDQWMELLSPVTQLLLDHGMDIHSKPGLVVEPAGLELDSTSDHWVNSSDCCGRVAVIFDQRRPAGRATTPPPFGALWS